MSISAPAHRLPFPRPLFSREALQSDNAPLLALAAISFVGHMLVAGNYGYFRDELYYLVDGRHLQLGYVDQPLLMGLLSALMNALAGDNLIAIHIIPALCAASIVFVTGLIARELGGGRFAQVLAAIAALFALVFMATGSIFSMDVIDELCWAVGTLILVRLLKRDEPRLWLLFGLVAGISLTAKLTMLFFGFSLTIALLLVPERRYFRTRWIWLGGAIAFAFLLPYILWNALNGFPTWQFWHHYGGVGNSPLGFFTFQFLLLNPLAVPLAVAGVIFYFRQENRRYRVLGWTFVILFAILALGTFKPYFLPPIYPLLFAPGAISFEQFFQRRPRVAWLGPAYAGALAFVGLLLAPLAMPILPPAAFVSHYSFLTGAGNGGAGQQSAGAFPQYLGDRFGWDTMMKTVARVYSNLPRDEQAHACVFTINYGEASALVLLGTHDSLPPVISAHNNYYLWGPGRCDGSVIIVVGLHADYQEAQILTQQYYRHVAQAATITCQYCMSVENDIPVLVFTQPKFSSFAHDVWPRLKHYD
jgi:4-amino-4-deoxy-L-arabinose transferase-like glycosyltransferase